MNCSNPLAKVTIKKLLLIFLLLPVLPLAAQDSTFLPQGKIADSLSSKRIITLEDTTAFVMKKSPWGAVLRSALLPGLGQFYNQSYWKVPLVWGALGYFVYHWNSLNNSYKRYRDLYSESINSTTGANDDYYTYREFYRDQRDLFAIYIGITYFLNLVDAYVDAHLFDFDVSNNGMTTTMNLNLHVRF